VKKDNICGMERYNNDCGLGTAHRREKMLENPSITLSGFAAAAKALK